MIVNPSTQNSSKRQREVSPSEKAQVQVKKEQQTAQKSRQTVLNQNQKIRIRNQLFSLYKHDLLKGKIKVQELQDLSQINIVLYHKINNRNIHQNIKIIFSQLYPEEPPKIIINSCSLVEEYPQYIVPNFLALNQYLTTQKWSKDVQLADVLAKVKETIQDFHVSQLKRFISLRQDLEEEEESSSSLIKQNDKQIEGEPKNVKQRRKSSNMTGCADKQLTETKNLNRHFRSKLREVLKEVGTQEQKDDYKMVTQLFEPNRVGFDDIRKALSNKWFNRKVRVQMNSGQFLNKILRGMMGIKSKKLMIKYYHVMVSAVEQPTLFTRWKYD